MKELLAREIFATGTHNGDRYTAADLDEMVRAFAELDFKPALKAGHIEEPGMKSLGWVTRLWREGEKLLADFSHIPEDVYSLIVDKKAYDRVSAEVFWDFERAGKTFKRALKAVALLGAEIPAVAGLKPLSAMFADNLVAKTYTASLDPRTNPNPENRMFTKEQQEAIDRQIKEAAEKAAQTATAALEAKYKTENEEREKRYAKEREADAKRLADLETQRAADAIEVSVKACTIPALHPHLRVFATLAHAQKGDAAAKKYALGEGADKKPVEGTAQEALNALISEINTKGARLFTVASTAGKGKDSGAEYDPNDRASVDAEVEKRTKAFKAEASKTGKTLKTSEAQDAVFAADAELAKAYTEVHAARAA